MGLRNVFHHEGYGQPFDVLAKGVLHDGTNTLAVLVENTNGPGGMGWVTVSRLLDSVTLHGWKLKGGPGDPDTTVGYKAFAAADAFSGPTFFRTIFQTAHSTAVGLHPIWRVIFAGLGHGSIWVNGHNLGRYPEKIAINGLYIPEPWLKSGINSLVIYDEDGKRPDQVTITAEAAASRDVVIGEN